ncbi:MAG: FG-GAP repeat protein [Sedimentisphaerales bacterium]|nr:FG-GAP repeat protein [Sedimentisphaerales bacterium]
MLHTDKPNYLAIPVILLQLVFSCPVLAYLKQAKLVASDANASDRLGVSVAIDGQTAVVGAYQNDSNGPDAGAAYVYEFSGSAWQQHQKLVASDASAGDQFGRSVAIEANTIVVGAHYGDANDPNTGSAYVFTRSGTVWNQQQKLAALDAATDDRFGMSVSISGDTLVVGAYGDDRQTGAAYVFTRNDQIWTQLQKLTTSDANTGDFFGWSAAINANIIAVGAMNDDHYNPPINTDAGTVYIFTRSGQIWSQQAILRASDAADSDHFGCSVALDGNFAVIGAYECDINGVPNVGAAYVFEKNYTGWVEKQKLFDADTPNNGDDFGKSVAIEGDTIFAGCVNHIVDGNQVGAVFEFTRTGQTWFQKDLLIAGDGNDDDNFGFSIAVSGQYLFSGAPYNDAAGLNSGSAYVFKNDDLTCDLDGDSDIDFADFAVFALAWLATPAQPAYNPDCDLAIPPDSLINSLDLAVLCDFWLAGK